jgi:hypothetical protein
MKPCRPFGDNDAAGQWLKNISGKDSGVVHIQESIEFFKQHASERLDEFGNDTLAEYGAHWRSTVCGY